MLSKHMTNKVVAEQNILFIEYLIQLYFKKMSESQCVFFSVYHFKAFLVFN